MEFRRLAAGALHSLDRETSLGPMNWTGRLRIMWNRSFRKSIPGICLLAVGCLAPEGPDVEGTIRSIDVLSRGEGFVVERSIFVDGGADCSQRSTVFYQLDTPIMRRTGSSKPAYVIVDTSALAVGARVMVWTADFRETSCPPRRWASSIVVLP